MIAQLKNMCSDMSEIVATSHSMMCSCSNDIEIGPLLLSCSTYLTGEKQSFTLVERNSKDLDGMIDAFCKCFKAPPISFLEPKTCILKLDLRFSGKDLYCEWFMHLEFIVFGSVQVSEM